MPTRNAARMTTAQIVAEITHLRSTVEGASRRIYELSRMLYDQMRRGSVNGSRNDATANDSRDAYVTYANSWTRFAGMIQQGLQRMRHSDRLLRMIEDDAHERAERPAPEDPETSHPQPVNIDQAHAVPNESPLRDFIDLYGEEMVRDADGQRQR
jgi:hypothetical protein